MRSILVGLTFFGSGVMVWSCNDAGTSIGGPGFPSVLLPLNQGNSWTMHFTTFNADGSIAAEGTFDYTAGKDTVVDGKTWTLMKSTDIAYRNDSVGLHWTNWTDEITYFYPTQAGESSNFWTVVSIDTLIQTAAGAFNCHFYERFFLDIPTRMFFSPGFGFVRSELPVLPPRGGPHLAQIQEVISARVQ